MNYGQIDRRALHVLRSEAGLTQRELAKLAEVSLSLIKKAEQGTRQLSLRTRWKLARALNCRPDDFTLHADTQAAA